MTFVTFHTHHSELCPGDGALNSTTEHGESLFHAHFRENLPHRTCLCFCPLMGVPGTLGHDRAIDSISKEGRRSLGPVSTLKITRVGNKIELCEFNEKLTSLQLLS